jgi:hypothetical protein
MARGAAALRVIYEVGVLPIGFQLEHPLFVVNGLRVLVYRRCHVNSVFTIVIRIHEPKRRPFQKKSTQPKTNGATKTAALFQAQLYIGKSKKNLKGINKIFKGATRERCCYQMIGDKLYIQDEGGAIVCVII